MEESGLIEFGEAAKEHFMLSTTGENAITFLNQGSYGAVPRVVHEAKKRHEDEVETNPDFWFRDNVNFRRWMQSLKVVCEFLKISVDNTVFVRNVTEGTNTVVKSIEWKEDDVILGTCLNYVAVKNLMGHVTRSPPPRLHTVDLFPVVTDKVALLRTWTQTLDETAGVRLAIIEAICSPVPALLPLREMIDACRARGILVHVDAAHAPGQCDIDYESLGAHSVTGNLHKWAFCPRPSGFLWVAPEHRDSVFPLITSNYHAQGWHRSFAYQGTGDTSGFVACADGVRFYRDRLGGLERVTRHNRSILDEMAPLVAAEIGAELFPLPADMEAACLRLLRLPPLRGYPAEIESEERLRAAVYKRHNISTVFIVLQHQLWLRLSCSVYNTESDFRDLAAALKGLFAEINRTE